jgi:CRP-like cAMP-binding protein
VKSNGCLDAANLQQVIGARFPSATVASRDQLIRGADLHSLRRDEIIYRQGDMAFVVVVLNGFLAMRRTTVDGRQLIPEILAPGRVAGLLSVAFRPAIVDLLSLTEAEVATWTGAELRLLVARDQGFALDLLDLALATVELLSARLDSLLYQDARRRVARVLVLYRDLFFGEPVVLTKAHLPALVGTSREMTGRVLRDLEADQVVRRGDRGNLCLVDGVRLDTVALA